MKSTQEFFDPRHSCFSWSHFLSPVIPDTSRFDTFLPFFLMFIYKKNLIFYHIFDIPNKNFENSMGDFWVESILLASLATERFLCQKTPVETGHI